MATAAEGKTTDTNQPDVPLCDVCEEGRATQYCIVCPGPICDNCVKSHKKTKITRDHTLCDLTLSRLGSSYVQSGEAPEGLSKCQKHKDKEQEYFCGDCICFLCTDCKGEHQDHKIQLARDDISVYRTVYHDHMKKMVDGIHDLEQYKNVLQKMIEQYEIACAEVNEKADGLVQTIKENSERLIGELRAVQGELKQLLGDAKSGLIKEIDSADLGVSKLRDVRKVEDCEVMSHALESSRNDLSFLNDYKKSTRRAKIVPTEKILPYKNEIDLIKDDVQVYFAMEMHLVPFEHTCILENCYTLAKKSRMDVSNSKGKQGYRFCKSRMGRNLVIHAKSADDIRVIDDMGVQIKRITPEVGIWNMVSVYHNEHVVKPTRKNEISLLDESFKVVFTQKEVTRQLKAICYYAPHQFIISEVANGVIYLSIILVKGMSLLKQKEINITGVEEPGYIEMYPDKVHVGLTCPSKKFLWKINLKTSTFTKHDVSTFMEGYIWSLFIDDKGITYVGDVKGNVHTFDLHMNHKIIVKIDDAVRDVIVKDGRLLVSSKDNKLYVFS